MESDKQMPPQELMKPISRTEEWILLFLLDREKSGQVTTGNDFWLFADDVEPLAEKGYVSLHQSHAIPSLQNKISPSTIVTLTDIGRWCFER